MATKQTDLMKAMAQSAAAENQAESTSTTSASKGRSLKSALKSTTIANKNAAILSSLFEKLGKLKPDQQSEFIIYLLKMNNVEWKLVGQTNEKIDAGCDLRIKKIEEGSQNVNNIKRINEHREFLKAVRKMITLSPAEANFVSPANLLKSPLASTFREIGDLGSMAYVKMGDKDTLEMAQSPWVPKVLDHETYTVLVAARQIKVFELITSKKPAGSTEVPEDTHIKDINSSLHHPRQWMTIINPRKALTCRGKDGRNLTKEEKTELLNWVAEMEGAIILLSGEKNAARFTLDRFDDDGNITKYWEQMVEAYKYLNEKIIKLKGPNAGKSEYTPWSDIEATEYNAANFFSQHGLDINSGSEEDDTAPVSSSTAPPSSEPNPAPEPKTTEKKGKEVEKPAVVGNKKKKNAQ